VQSGAWDGTFWGAAVCGVVADESGRMGFGGGLLLPGRVGRTEWLGKGLGKRGRNIVILLQWVEKTVQSHANSCMTPPWRW
jgi:hypothetical protein